LPNIRPHWVLGDIFIGCHTHSIPIQLRHLHASSVAVASRQGDWGGGKAKLESTPGHVWEMPDNQVRLNDCGYALSPLRHHM